MKNPKLFVTGINTGVGKTVVSAVLAQGLTADYWKPVQSGSPTDTETVASLVSYPEFTAHPEAFRLKDPLSPHAAAQRDGVEIVVRDIKIPVTTSGLIIEGAGGVLSPLSLSSTVADLIQHTEAIAVVVVKHYLGSINHTLLSLHELTRRKIPIAGIIVSGENNKESEEAIKVLGNTRIIATVPEVKLTKENIAALGEKFKSVMSFVLKGCF